MGAPRLYWWWDVICPVCQPLSSYSYAIHTVGPPRPLIPVSRGGGQTAKQTGGWAASLLGRCSTRRAWRSVSHLQRFQQRYRREAAKQRAPRASGNPGSYNVAQTREFVRAGAHVIQMSLCSKGGLRLPGLLPYLTLHPLHNNILVTFYSPGFPPGRYTALHASSAPLVTTHPGKFAQDVISRCLPTNRGRVYVIHLFKHDLRNEQIDHSLESFALQTHLLWIKVWHSAKVIKVN